MRFYVRMHEERVQMERLSFHHALIEAIDNPVIDAADRAADADAQMVGDKISRLIAQGSGLSLLI